MFIMNFFINDIFEKLVAEAPPDDEEEKEEDIAAVSDDSGMIQFINMIIAEAIHMDATELKEAVWVARSDVVGQPNDFSLTNEMMMVFKAGKEPR